MPILEIKNLCKEYPKFKLSDVSFSLEAGRIMGFIGRNGAGKTTTLKSILNIIHPSSGSIKYFGMDLCNHEAEIKQLIGFAGGSVDYYKRKKISAIVSNTKMFYKEWDDELFEKYIKAFSIDVTKKPLELSEGMKVKLNLAIAMSHNAKLLILDEPTSGLDPVSRDELLEIFIKLKNKGAAILFSTHITSDLDKCADDVTYIHDGKIVATDSMEHFLSDADKKGLGKNLEEIMISCEKENYDEKLDF